jgi:hypothetical protein
MQASEGIHGAHCENGITVHGHVPTKAVLDAANASSLEQVVVIGVDRFGDFYCASSCNADMSRELAEKFLRKLETGF